MPAKVKKTKKSKDRVSPKRVKKSSKKTSAKNNEQEPKAISRKRGLPSFVKFFFKGNRFLYLLAAVILLAGAGYYFRNYFIAATVNGQPITRFSVISELETSYGKSILDNKINEVLIKQKADAAQVNVTQEEIDQAISEIEMNMLGEGQSIDDVLALQGLTRQDLEDQIKIQLMVEKLLEGDVVVTEEEINKYIEENAEAFPEDASNEEKTQTARNQIRQRKLSERFPTWMQELRDEAQINYIIDYAS